MFDGPSLAAQCNSHMCGSCACAKQQVRSRCLQVACCSAAMPPLPAGTPLPARHMLRHTALLLNFTDHCLSATPCLDTPPRCTSMYVPHLATHSWHATQSAPGRSQTARRPEACAFDTQRGLWHIPGIRNAARRSGPHHPSCCSNPAGTTMLPGCVKAQAPLAHAPAGQQAIASLMIKEPVIGPAQRLASHDTGRWHPVHQTSPVVVVTPGGWRLHRG